MPWDAERDYMNDTVNAMIDTSSSDRKMHLGYSEVPVPRVGFETKRTFFA